MSLGPAIAEILASYCLLFYVSHHFLSLLLPHLSLIKIV
jgi:hypothetical protein